MLQITSKIDFFFYRSDDISWSDDTILLLSIKIDLFRYATRPNNVIKMFHSFQIKAKFANDLNCTLFIRIKDLYSIRSMDKTDIAELHEHY